MGASVIRVPAQRAGVVMLATAIRIHHAPSHAPGPIVGCNDRALRIPPAQVTAAAPTAACSRGRCSSGVEDEDDETFSSSEEMAPGGSAEILDVDEGAAPVPEDSSAEPGTTEAWSSTAPPPRPRPDWPAAAVGVALVRLAPRYPMHHRRARSWDCLTVRRLWSIPGQWCPTLGWSWSRSPPVRRSWPRSRLRATTQRSNP